MAEPPGTFAVLLRKLRTEAGLTQEELAEAARPEFPVGQRPGTGH